MGADDLEAEKVNMHEAKTHLSKLVERVEGGEEIVISRAGKPAAKLVPVARPKKLGPRKLGGWEGIEVPSDEEWREFKEELAKDFEESDLMPPEERTWRGD
jgi:prevent-host-death family protein